MPEQRSIRALGALIFALALCLLYLSITTNPLAAQTSADPAKQQPLVQVAYFYALDCPHCRTVQEQVLVPLQAEYTRLDIRFLEISVPTNYELLIRTEEYFKIRADARGIPTLVIGERILIGEDTIRAELPARVEQGLAQGGIGLPNIPGLENATGQAETPPGSVIGCPAVSVQSDSCSAANPIWVAYFYQIGCQKCSRASSDLQYVKSQHPQLVIDEFNIYDNPALAEWLAKRAGRQDVYSPALFIGGDALIGETEITPQAIVALANKYASTGAGRTWAEYQGTPSSLAEQFRALGPLTVVFAGLVDGLNPCAFATLVFLISYLTFAGRKGREVLAVGGAFTFGVFTAYFGVGLGFYKVLDLLGSFLTTLSRWVYALTAVLCAILAIYSFFDFLKARRGKLTDMTLRLPSFLRRRVNAVVRTGAQARAFVVAAFVTGVLISLIELACTGQIYLPTIIFVASIPELRVQAISYLLLYNVVFVLPLLVVFVLAYFGTTSHQLGAFLERNTAQVKLGAVILFATLATWLGFSLFV